MKANLLPGAKTWQIDPANAGNLIHTQVDKVQHVEKLMCFSNITMHIFWWISLHTGCMHQALAGSRTLHPENNYHT